MGDLETGYEFVLGLCPECEQPIVLIRFGKYRWDEVGEIRDIQREEVIYPKCPARCINSIIPCEYRDAFNEANSVLGLSPKASAALSRRLLQRILWDKYEIKKRNLSDEISDFLNLPDIPDDIKDEVDAIRQVGNFAAHPLKDTNTGEIVDVEPDEAGWLLEVLEELLDFTFVQACEKQKRKDRLNQKLKSFGKPSMK